MKRYLVAATAIFFILGGIAYANSTTSWTDWTSAANGVPGSAQGTIAVPDETSIEVTYTGEVNFAQTAGDEIYYWDPTTPYISTTVENPPPDSDIIALVGGTSTVNTILFSRPVENPVMAILSLGRISFPVRYQFDTPFEILSFGEGYWGNGDLVELSGNVLQGNEGHGVIRFFGTVGAISFTAPDSEGWHGFTVGIPGGGGDVISECPQAELTAKFEEGKEFCRNHPEECGISTGGDYQAGFDDGFQAGLAECETGDGCRAATLSPDLMLHIPDLNYQSLLGEIHLWADFAFVGDQNGDLLWRLSDFGQK